MKKMILLAGVLALAFVANYSDRDDPGVHGFAMQDNGVSSGKQVAGAGEDYIKVEQIAAVISGGAPQVDEKDSMGFRVAKNDSTESDEATLDVKITEI